MSKQVYKNCKLFIGGYNLSGDVNELGLAYSAEIKDVTTYASGGSKEKLPGLVDFSADHKGFFDNLAAPNSGVDKTLFDKLALADEIMSIWPIAGAEGEIGYAGQVVEANYNPLGKIGDVTPFTVKVDGDGPLIRATCLGTGAKAATGNGTGYNLGAILATQRLYAFLHVVAASAASTLDVTIESDDAGGFATPITRATFTQMTAIGALWLAPIAGPITDTWWRAKWTIGGAGPSFTVQIGMAII